MRVWDLNTQRKLFFDFSKDKRPDIILEAPTENTHVPNLFHP
jgi:hypothetical protein